MWHAIVLSALLLPLTITPVDGGGEVDQPEQQTATINSEAVAIAVDYHAALLLACSDLIHTKEVSAVERCAKNYVSRILNAERKHEGK